MQLSKRAIPLLLAAACSTPQAPLIGQGLMTSYAVDFGQVVLGQQAQQTIAFSNAAATAFHVTAVDSSTDAEFKLGISAGTHIPATGVLNAPVTFTPQSAGAKSATIVLHSDAPAAPTITLSLTGQGITSGCQVTPTTVDFGSVRVGTTATAAITVTNSASLDCIVTPSAVQGPQAMLFALAENAPFTVATGASVTVNVTYAPLVPSTQDKAYMVLGTGVSRFVNVGFQGTAVQSCLQITPDPLDFSFVQPGHSSTLPLHLHNVCNEILTVSSATILDPGAPAAFSIASGSWTSGVLEPGEAEDVNVTFAPTTLDLYTGELDVSSGANSAVVPIKLIGFGGGAAISCSPLALDFQTVAAGFGSTLLVTCTNTGTDVPHHPEAGLSIVSLQTDNALFTAQVDAASPPQPIPAGGALEIDVTYLPTAATTDTGNLSIDSDVASVLPIVALSGNGIFEPHCSYSLTPAAVNFGQVTPGTDADEGFTITDLGPNECLVTGLHLGAGTEPVFTLESGPVVSQRLSAPGVGGPYPTSLTLAVDCVGSPGQHTGSVEFTIDDPLKPHYSVPLECGGASAGDCFVLRPATLDFRKVGTLNGQVCATGTQTFVGVNACAQDVTVTSVSVTVDAGGYSFVGPRLPLIVPQGVISAPFEVGFKASGVGTHGGDVFVQTSIQIAPIDLPITETVIAGTTVTDTFSGANYTLSLSGQPDPTSLEIVFDGPPSDQTPDGGAPGVFLVATNPDGTSNWSYDPTSNSIVLNTATVLLDSSDTIYVEYTLVCP
jgi:hypothetical protein